VAVEVALEVLAFEELAKYQQSLSLTLVFPVAFESLAVNHPSLTVAI